MALSTTDVDTIAARELDLYAENTAELYPQFMLIIRNMQRKLQRGVYDVTLAPKAWRYWYDAAAKRYIREFGNENDLSVTFPPAVRQYCADLRAADEYQKICDGEYD